MNNGGNTPLNEKVRGLLGQITVLQDELRKTLDEQEARVRYTIEGKKVEFEQAVRQAHARMRLRWWQWLRLSRPRNILAAPFIYGMALPLALFDLSLWLYQQICFPLFGIRPVKRSDYIIVDRHKLAYLNVIEKFNCVYCGYGNGLLAYAREIVARTEQYWCPIKHARKTLDNHAHYQHFMEYGDTENFRERWQQLRDDLVPDNHPRACEAKSCDACKH